MRNRHFIFLVCCMILLPTASLAVTDEQKCLSKRSAAWGKYNQCTQKWLSKVHRGTLPLGLLFARFEDCRQKHASVWPTLQALSATSCDVPRFVDNGSTVTDNLTGLVWEKKTDDGGANDWDDGYFSWTDGDANPADEDGSAFATFLSSLNSGAGFTSANGWRLPTLAELETLLTDVAAPLYIDPVFGPYTSGIAYWTSTTYVPDPEWAWSIAFSGGNAETPNVKSLSLAVRAVRGGL